MQHHSKDKIEEVITNGATSMGEIFDKTTAGVGACGGSCRPLLKKILNSYLETKTFPEKIIDHRQRRKK